MVKLLVNVTHPLAMLCTVCNLQQQQKSMVPFLLYSVSNTVKPVLSGPVLNGHPLLSGQL